MAKKQGIVRMEVHIPKDIKKKVASIAKKEGYTLSEVTWVALENLVESYKK